MSEQALTATVLVRVGAEAIYREGQGFSRVRVRDAKTTGWGVTATIDLIPTPGLVNARPSSWGISSAWEVFSCSQDRWDAPYISLSIYFGDDLVQAVVEFCSTLPAEYSAEHFGQIGRFVSRYWVDKIKRESGTKG